MISLSSKRITGKMMLAYLTARHCEQHKPALCLNGFSQEAYGLNLRSIQRISAGKRRASDQFLQRLHATHTRLFPGEPVDVSLPDNRVVHLGDGPLHITFHTHE